MCKPIYRVARVVLAIAITGLLYSVDGADASRTRKSPRPPTNRVWAPTRRAGARKPSLRIPRRSRPIAATPRRCARAQGLFQSRQPGKSGRRLRNGRGGTTGRRAILLRPRPVLQRYRPAGAGRAGFHHRPQSEAGTHRSLHRARPAYSATKHYDKAIDDFTQAIKLRLDNFEPYKGRGMAYSAVGKYRDAIDDFTAALSRKPDYEEVLVNARWPIRD